jgi:hypothetical protein
MGTACLRLISTPSEHRRFLYWQLQPCGSFHFPSPFFQNRPFREFSAPPNFPFLPLPRKCHFPEWLRPHAAQFSPPAIFRPRRLWESSAPPIRPSVTLAKKMPHGLTRKCRSPQPLKRHPGHLFLKVFRQKLVSLVSRHIPSLCSRITDRPSSSLPGISLQGRHQERRAGRSPGFPDEHGR